MDTTTINLESHSTKDSSRDHRPIAQVPVIRPEMDQPQTDPGRATLDHPAPPDLPIRLVLAVTHQPPPTLYGHRATITQGLGLPQDTGLDRPQAILQGRQTTPVDLTQATQELVEREGRQDQVILDRGLRTPGKVRMVPARLDLTLDQVALEELQVDSQDSLDQTTQDKGSDLAVLGSVMIPELMKVVTIQLFLAHLISTTLS